MSKPLNLLLAVAFLGGLAACAKEAPQEYVVVEPEPISSEPVYTGKYK